MLERLGPGLASRRSMAKKGLPNMKSLKELLYQALETEIGGVKVYEKALECAINEDLHEEWRRYLDETRSHVARLREVFEEMGLDEEELTPGRKVVRHIGQSLVKAIEIAQKDG